MSSPRPRFVAKGNPNAGWTPKGPETWPFCRNVRIVSRTGPMLNSLKIPCLGACGPTPLSEPVGRSAGAAISKG
jgi:hypothetical protein